MLERELLNHLSSEYFEKILEETAARSTPAYKAINSYYKMFKALRSNPDVKDYFKFKESVMEAAGKISLEDFKVLVRCLTISVGNLSGREINVHREMFEINNLMIENDIFLEDNGYLKEIHFIKYISYCCNCGEIQSAESFLKKFSSKIPDNTRENCLNHTRAEISFAEGDFNVSLELLSRVTSLYFEMKYAIKSLQILNYFELNDYESFLYLLDSSKHLAKYNKPLELRITQNFTKFYNAVNELFQYKNNKAAIDLKLLKKNIIDSNPYRRTWLLKKIDTLEGIR